MVRSSPGTRLGECKITIDFGNSSDGVPPLHIERGFPLSAFGCARPQEWTTLNSAMVDKHIKTSATGLLGFLPICCPCGGCLDERDHSDGTVDGSLVCESCGASHPVSGGVPDFIHPKMLLDMPVDLFGAWHVTQINGEERYKVNDPASLSLETREDVIQVKQLLGMQGLDVLDVGSGSNAVPGYIEEDRVRSFVAVDPLSPSGRPPMNLVRAMAEYLPFEDESFDLVQQFC